MKFRNYLIAAVAVVVMAGSNYVAQTYGGPQFGTNRIEGRVMDETNNGVNNVYVELYDYYGTLINRQRSTGQGRFSFAGMREGRYTVSVKPYGTNLMEDSQEVVIDNSAARSITVPVDFRLRQDKRFAATDIGIVGTVFAQEVPEDARKLYRSGIDEMGSQPDKGRADLEAAIKIFPTYFDALAALGKANILKGRFAEGYPFLLRAIDVNKRCSDCYYSLAIAFYKLDEGAAAVKAIDAAAILQPKSGTVRLLQGMIARQNNDFVGAEKALLLAKEFFSPPNAEVHWQLSLVFNRLKKNGLAADELEQYLKTKHDMKQAEKDSVRELITKLRKTT